MQWFKHDSDSSTDAKLKKLTLRHGAEGYAIYFHCLELISGDISENNLTFELEHDSEIIADNLKIKSFPEMCAIDRVNNIMNYIVDLGLFEKSGDRIFCLKMLKRLDLSMTSSPRFRKMIQKAKETNHDYIMTGHDLVMQEENRIEENRIEQNTIDKKKTDNKWITLYFDRFNKKYCLTRSPENKDFINMKKIQETLSDDFERYEKCIDLWFTKNYWGNYDEKTKKSKHHTGSFLACLPDIVTDIDKKPDMSEGNIDLEETKPESWTESLIKKKKPIDDDIGF